jgi:hypothetical protein
MRAAHVAGRKLRAWKQELYAAAVEERKNGGQVYFKHRDEGVERQLVAKLRKNRPRSGGSFFVSESV